jgi:hypothetical protein
VKSISTIDALKATEASSSRARNRGAFLTASSTIYPQPKFQIEYLSTQLYFFYIQISMIPNETRVDLNVNQSKSRR